MKVTYIHHSSFMAELEHAALLFDYFEGEILRWRGTSRFLYLPATGMETIFPALSLTWRTKEGM